MTRFSFLLLTFACFCTMACKGKQAVSNDTAADTANADTAVSATNATTEGSETDTVRVKNYEYKQSDKYADVNITIDIPDGTDAASAVMRRNLFGVIDKKYAFDYEGKRVIPACKDGFDETEKYIPYYIKGRQKSFSAESKETNEDLGGDELMQATDELKITKEREIGSLVVFNMVNFIYNAGAAHPSTLSGTYLYNKKTGKEVKQLLIAGAEKKMQKLLVKGVMQYFKEMNEECTDETVWDLLILENKNYIPLPAETLCPRKDGLCFNYAQYEIACYAAGMPAFVIPYNDLKPYLTEEAKQLLGL